MTAMIRQRLGPLFRTALRRFLAKNGELGMFSARVTHNPLKTYVCDKPIQAIPNFGAGLFAEPCYDPAEGRGESKRAVAHAREPGSFRPG